MAPVTRRRALAADGPAACILAEGMHQKVSLAVVRVSAVGATHSAAAIPTAAVIPPATAVVAAAGITTDTLFIAGSNKVALFINLKS